MEKIVLSEFQKKLIKITKGHYDILYPFKGSWTKTLKPLFKEEYMYFNMNQYRVVLFEKLFDTYMLIRRDGSGTDQDLKGIFNAVFYKGIARNDNKPIDRAIAELCGLIQSNLVVDGGVPRYDL